MIPIEKNVPIPQVIRGGHYKYPWVEMEIGDSFVVAASKEKTIRSQASVISLRISRQFTVRKQDDKTVRDKTVRVWRTK